MTLALESVRVNNDLGASEIVSDAGVEVHVPGVRNVRAGRSRGDAV